MAYKEIQSLETDNTVSLGGFNKKAKKDNPKQAEGYYLGSKTVASKMSSTGEAQLHVLQTSNGNLGVWGKTDLDRKMRQVPVGAMIRITQSGTRPSNKGNEMYLFKVEVDTDNTIEVNFSDESSVVTNDDSEGYEDAEENYDEEDDVELASPPPARTTKPAQAAAAPDAARQAKVRELLAKGRSKTA